MRCSRCFTLLGSRFALEFDKNIIRAMQSTEEPDPPQIEGWLLKLKQKRMVSIIMSESKHEWTESFSNFTQLLALQFRIYSVHGINDTFA